MTKASDLSPKVFGRNTRYILGEELGMGAITRVFRCTDTLLKGERAVKLLRPQHVDSLAARTRILTEARSLAKVTHPNVVRVYHLVHSELGPALIMELAAGRLLDVVPIWPLPVAHAIAYTGEVLDGLTALHTHGVLHRNLEPRNLLLSARGKLLISDLYGARLDGEDRLLSTSDGESVSSVLFSAPELRTTAGDASPQSDIYSVGATLWMLLTGRPPPDLSLLFMDASRLARIPPELHGILMTATAREPSRRYLSASSMRAALDSVRTEEIVPS